MSPSFQPESLVRRRGAQVNPELAISNRFFASYNRFRDFREPFSEDFPTIEIAEGGVTYTTAGHEPFSIHNILDQDGLQLTNNFTFFKGRHVVTGGVNGDGSAANDLIYIPQTAADINLADVTDAQGTVVDAASDQWARLDAFIEQDDYLSTHRGQIAERFGAVNPWYSNIDLRLLQDVSFLVGGQRNTLQLSLDVLNVANLLNSSWGVRKVAGPAATSPLRLVGFDEAGEPVFNFAGPAETYVDDPSEFSRWRAQFGIRYLFN